MSKETKLGLSIVGFTFLLIVLLKQVAKPKEYPKCEDYGYDEHTTIVMNTKSKLLSIQCVGEFNVKSN